jgi:hypothetical protein
LLQAQARILRLRLWLRLGQKGLGAKGLRLRRILLKQTQCQCEEREEPFPHADVVSRRWVTACLEQQLGPS